MHCEGCLDNIKHALRGLPGVVSVDASPQERLVTVGLHGAKTGRDEICSAITAIGHVCGEE
jgi:copper chaperone CopZ